MAERGKGFKGQRGRFRGGRRGGRGVTRGPTGHKLIQLTIDLDNNTSNYLEWRKAFLVEAKEKLSWELAMAMENDQLKVERAPVELPEVPQVVFKPEALVSSRAVKDDLAGGQSVKDEEELKKEADKEESKPSGKEEYPDILDDEYEEFDELGAEFGKLFLREVAKDVASELRQDVKKGRNFYATIFKYLSSKSEAQIKAHHQYAKASKSGDLLLLWKIIKETHSTHMQGGTSFDRNQMMKVVYNMRQGKDEDLADYRERFENKNKEAEGMGCIIGSDDDRVTRFIESLSRVKYGSYIDHVINDLTLKGRASTVFPKDLDQAVSQATKYKSSVNARVADRDYGAVFSTRGRGGRGQRGRGGKGGRGEGNRNRGESKKDQSKEEAEDEENSKRKGKCYICDEKGHWAKDCPLNQDIDETIEEEEEQSTTKSSTTATKGGKSGGGVGDAGKKKGYLTVLSQRKAEARRLVALTRQDGNLVCLDTCANINIMCSHKLCSNVKKNADKDTITGIGGDEFVPRFEASFTDLDIEVKLDNRAQANIISFSLVCKKYSVKYDEYSDEFLVYKPPYVYVFENYDGIYARYFSEQAKLMMYKTLITTVQDNEALYTPREVRAARDVREFMIVRGLTSNAEMIRMINSGGILNCPFTVHDVHRANKIYGPDIASLKGKQKKTKPFAPKAIENPWRPIRMAQTLCIDLFQICGLWFLISLTLPLGMLMVTFLPTSKKLGGVWKALINQISAYKSRMFSVSTIRSDQEGAIVALKEKLNERNIYLELAGRAQHVGPIENAIGRVKSRARGIMAQLPYKLCKILLIYLTGYCITRINQSLNDKTPGALCPFSNFKLRKLDIDIDYRIGFGEYAQVHEHRELTGTMEPRTTGAISLCPTGNLTGSQKFLSLSTKKVITRDKWTKLPIPQSVINKLNKWAVDDKTPMPDDITYQYRGKEVMVVDDVEAVPEPAGHIMRVPREAREAVEDAEAALQMQNELDEEPDNKEGGVEDPSTEADSSVPNVGVEGQVSDGANEIAEETEETEAVGEAEVDSGSVSNVEETDAVEEADVDGRDESKESEETSVEETYVPVGREGLRERIKKSYERFRYQNTERSAKGSSKLSGGKALFTRVTSNRHNGKQLSAYHISVKEAVNKFSKKAVKSMVKEVINVYGNGKNITPIRVKDLTHKQRKGIIRSMMFLKDKYLPTGEFEKLKARLVALGNFQDRSLFGDEDTASPTVSLLSLLALVTKSHSEGRVFKTVDIPGAYLKADIGDKEVIMKLDKLMSHILAKIDPSVESYIDENGEIVVKLNKALYGCVQSALQWYKEISSYLVSIGFQINRMDTCVFNKEDINGKQLTIVMHVDDLMFMGAEDSINIVIGQLREKYGDVTVHEGLVLPYLGMVFDFTRSDKVKISMDKYVEDLLRLYEVKGKAKTPAMPDLLKVDETSKLLNESEREEFHSRVAKLLYLAKRVRPEILTAVIFLTGRVNCATEQDRDKLNRVLHYLNYYPKLGIGLSTTGTNMIFSFIDVSFATEVDYKSRTGVVISLGGGPVYAESSKQKLNTTGSTESELVGCSDGSKNVIWLRNFLIEQGYKILPAKIYQDNKSTLALIKNGRSSNRSTRHINIRYFFLKDRVESGEIELQYLPTNEMIADLLTKPLQGVQFRILRDKLLNYQ